MSAPLLYVLAVFLTLVAIVPYRLIVVRRVHDEQLRLIRERVSVRDESTDRR